MSDPETFGASSTARRRFRSDERVSLYLVAEGCCEECGIELEPGWHSDHITPYSKGGLTDVVNGQALCPSCNLSKGARTIVEQPLRTWQSDALERFLGSNKDFLTVACPGAGKTTFATVAATKLMEAQRIQKVIVVAPSAHLRQQWSHAAAKRGLKLDPDYMNGDGALAPDFDGVVVTYATVAASPSLWRALTSRNRTLVILDEVHHCGEADHLAWGRAALQAFEPATRRLLLSGTPIRTDGKPIPFVEYRPDVNGLMVAEASFGYDYGTALQEGGVVRPIAFPVQDGDMEWRYAGTVTRTLLKDAEKDSLPKALRTAYDPKGEWIGSVLRQADEELTSVRNSELPNAGGLVVASDKAHAKAYAEVLWQITRQRPVVVVSEDKEFPDPSGDIERFSRGTARWIVAVNMVSEGVDIPRLAVGVYASKYRTELFFRQLVGRVTRLLGEDDFTTARLFIPHVDSLVAFARIIEQTVQGVLKEEKEFTERPSDGSGKGMQGELEILETLASSEAVHSGTIHRGDDLTGEEIEHAKSVLRQDPGAARISAEDLARLLRISLNQAPSPVAPAPTSVLVPIVQANGVRLSDQKNAKKKEIRRLVAIHASNSGRQHSHIHNDLNQKFGEASIRQATLETLEKRINVLKTWM